MFARHMLRCKEHSIILWRPVLLLAVVFVPCEVSGKDACSCLAPFSISSLSVQPGDLVDDNVCSRLSCTASLTWNAECAHEQLALLSQYTLPHVLSRLVNHCSPLPSYTHDPPSKDKLGGFCVRMSHYHTLWGGFCVRILYYCML